MESSLDVGMDIGGVLINSWAPTPPIMRKEIKLFYYGHFRRPLGVTQSDNGASKKSIGNEPKIHLCGVIPNKLKHGGFGHRPSPLESFCPCVRVFGFFVLVISILILFLW